MSQILTRNSDIADIKRIPILDVADRLRLGARRGRSAHCPFPGHNDAKPSFSFYPDTNTCWCHACGTGGSVIDLVAISQSWPVGVAIRWLRETFRGGVTTSNAGNRQLSVGGAWRLRAEINTAIMTSQVRPPVNGETSDFAANVEIYEALLADNPMGGDAAVYLKSRGFSDATVSCFRLGFLRDARTTVQLLVNRFGNEAVYHAGLLSHRDKNATFILPSPSVLFPFIDSGRVVYIQSRILPSGDGKRWMGPRGVAKPVYNVGAISRSKAIYLCEGATDVLSAHELNLAAIGVLGGTSRLPNSVMGALRTHMVYIVPDCDDVGGRMATKMTDSLRGFGVQSVIKSLPMGKDINEYLLMSRKLK